MATNPITQYFGNSAPRDQFLGTMVSSLGGKTNASSPLNVVFKPNAYSSLGPTQSKAKGPIQSPFPSVTPSSPSATSPVASPNPAITSPKDTFVQNNVASTTPTTTSPSYPSNSNISTPSGAVVNPNTGELISSPAQDKNASYKSAFDAYIASLMPSDSESAATKNLNDLTLQAQKDEETALNRGETLGFAAGEAARVNRNRSFDITAASNALNAITGQRTATSSAAKARLDFEKSLRDENQNEPFTLSEGQSRYEYNPKSGKYEKTASVAKTYAPNSGVGSLSTTAQAVIQNPGLWQSLTPSVKTALLPELVAAGFDTTKFNILGLPASQQEDITTMATVQNFVNELLNLGESSGGKLEGVGGLGSGSISKVLFGQLGIGTAGGQSNRNLIGQIQGAIAKLRGGTSFTPNEQALLETYTPTINDSDPQILQKLKDLNRFIENKRSNLLSLVGGNIPSGAAATSTSGEGGDYAAYLKAIGQ